MFNNSISTLLEFIISLSILLFVHELGHYLVGKILGIKADEFGFGYPPRIIKLFTWKGTDFTVNLIPFGAFVRFHGEDDPTVKGGLYSANKWKRLATLLAGSVMNLLTGIILFSLVVTQSGIPQTDTVEIVGIAPNSPAHIAGIMELDIIEAVKGVEITNMVDVGEIIQDNLGEDIDITLLRNDEPVIINVIPRENPPEGEGAIGIIMQYPSEKIGFLRSIPYGWEITIEQGRQLLSIPAMLLSGEVDPQDTRMLSPKGIYDVYSQVRAEGQSIGQDDPSFAFLNVAWFFGIISVSLGFSNLLPIPALDGGRILFIIPEILFGKRVPAKYENLIHFIGYSVLLILMGYVFFQDIINPIVLP